MISSETFNGRNDLVELQEVVEFLDHIRKPVKESERIPGEYPYYGANGQQGTTSDYIFDEPLVLLAEDGGHFGIPGRPIAYRVSGKCMKLKQLPIPLPPLCVQQHFSRICLRVHEYNTKLSKSEGELDNQFNSLAQRAFRGKL